MAAAGKKDVVDSLAHLHLREDISGAFSLRFSPDSAHLAIGLGDGSVEVREINDSGEATRGKATYLIGGEGEKLPVTAMRFHNNLLTVGGTNGTIKFWDYETGDLVKELKEPGNEILALDYSSNGAANAKFFATAGKDRAIRLYDAKTQRLISEFDGRVEQGDAEHVFCVRFHPEHEHMCISGGWGRLVKVWDVRVPYTTREIQGPKVCGESIDVSGDHILTASWNNRNQDALQLWDWRYASREPVSVQYAGSQGPYLYAAQFNRAGSLFCAGGSGMHDARVFRNDDTKEEVARLSMLDETTNKPGAIHCVEFSPDGRFLALGGTAPLVDIASLHAEKPRRASTVKLGK